MRTRKNNLKRVQNIKFLKYFFLILIRIPWDTTLDSYNNILFHVCLKRNYKYYFIFALSIEDKRLAPSFIKYRGKHTLKPVNHINCKFMLCI